MQNAHSRTSGFGNLRRRNLLDSMFEGCPAGLWWPGGELWAVCHRPEFTSQSEVSKNQLLHCENSRRSFRTEEPETRVERVLESKTLEASDAED